MNQAEKILLEQVRQNKTPAVQYIHFNKDSILTKYSYGLADIKADKPANELTTYNAFSVTKTFTALSILQLAEKNRLNIDSPAANYLPAFPYASNITIRQILSHSAGIPNPIPLNWIHLVAERAAFDRNVFFKNIFLKHDREKTRPNDKFAYSNLGYVLLGQLIESVTGLSYEHYVCEHIIKKIEINSHDLGFEIADISGHATGYHKGSGFTNLMLGLFIDKSKLMGKAEGKWKPFNKFYVNGTAYGGLVGKPTAFVKYIQELLNPNSILLTDSFKKMLFEENYTNKNQSTGMCLSWFKGKLNGHTYFAHAGGGGGYYCEIRIYPENNLGSVIFFNRTGMTDERFLDRLDQILKPYING